MGNIIKSVAKAETFLLDYSDRRDLVGCQWPFGFTPWLAYRSVTALYLLVLLVVAFVNKFMRYQWKFFTFLTHWGFLMFVLNHILKWICLIKYKKWFTPCKHKDLPDEEKPLLFHKQSWLPNQEKNQCLLSFSWAVANIANVLAIIITINYWPGGTVVSFANLPDILNFQLHGVNAIMVLLDLVLVAQPTLLLHFYQPILFLCSYYSFTAFYYAAGGTSKYGTRAIYSFLNWDKPEQTLMDLLMLGLQVLAVHISMWLFAVLRKIIAGSIQNKQRSL